MREIGLKQADYFHKGFLTNFNLQKRIPIVTYFCILLSKCNYRNKTGGAINANGFHEKRPPTSRQFTGGFYWLLLYMETSQVSMEALYFKCMMPYLIMLKVRKFHQPAANRFSTARQDPVGGHPAWLGGHPAWLGGWGITSAHNKRGCAILSKKVAPKNPGTYLKLRPKNPGTRNPTLPSTWENLHPDQKVLDINSTKSPWYQLQKNWWRLNISLAVIWSLKNGSFSTIFKIWAEIVILSHILTPRKS